jgi:hypothetical protein
MQHVRIDLPTIVEADHPSISEAPILQASPEGLAVLRILHRIDSRSRRVLIRTSDMWESGNDHMNESID